jgi:membrane protein DedA with SNARE-associated domain
MLVTLEEAGIPIPIPGDTLVVLAGEQNRHLSLHAFAVIGVTSLAVVIGSSLLFAVTRLGGRPLLERYGKFIHLRPERLARMERGFQRHGLLYLIVGRLIPGLRIVTTVVAGLSNMPYRHFVLSVSIAAVIWSSGWYFLGTALGRELPFLLSITADLLDHIPKAVLIFGLVIVLASVAAGALYAHRWRRTPRAPVASSS